VDDQIARLSYNRILRRYKNKLMLLRAELEETKERKSVSSKMIDGAIQTIKNIPIFFMNGICELKVSLLGLLFPQN